MYDEKKIREIILTSKSRTEICNKLGIYPNGKGVNVVNDFIKQYNIDISHFSRRDKGLRINKICPVCELTFETKSGVKREKTTCSIACSNTYFRSGIKNDNYKDINELDKRSRTFCLKYRKICFDNHEHKCIVCGENKILDVHHFDENKFNNEPSNLIPICATHHNYLHSKYRGEIIDIVVRYRENYLKKL
jgi:hypothetical protein